MLETGWLQSKYKFLIYKLVVRHIRSPYTPQMGHIHPSGHYRNYVIDALSPFQLIETYLKVTGASDPLSSTKLQ